MSPTLVTVLIVAGALAAVGVGVGLLVFGVVKLPFALIGSAVRALIAPIANLFKGKKGKDDEAGEAKPAKPGVEEVAPPQMAGAAA